MTPNPAAPLSPARLIALFLAVFMAGACVIRTGGSDGGSGGGAPAADGQRAQRPTTEEFQEDTEGALGLAEQYWSARFRESNRQFSPVRRVIPYRTEGEVNCGGEPLPLNNAVYCSAGDFIAYDVNFAVNAFARVGDAFLYYLLGHEYGHSVQARLGLSSQYTIQQELQADCMAGAYIGDSIKAEQLTLEDGDIEEFREGLLAVGDDPSIAWFTPGAHGTAEQRTQAFFNGYENSLDACDLTG